MTDAPERSASAPGAGAEPRAGLQPYETGETLCDSLATIEIAKEYLSFSAGHFTLFSATERENLHGHNFRVACEVTAPVDETGLCFDYGALKQALKALCDQLDERVLLPGASPWVQIEHADGMVFALYAGERIPFLRRDALVLDVRNVTVEELAGWFLGKLRATPVIADNAIRRLRVRVSSGANQWASQDWSAA